MAIEVSGEVWGDVVEGSLELLPGVLIVCIKVFGSIKL